MIHGDRTALMAMRFSQAAELERLNAFKQELNELSLFLRWRRELKYSPDQPRDANGRWMPWDHGEGAAPADGTTSDTAEAFGVAPDGTLIEEVAECTGISAHALQRMQERGITPDAVKDTLTNPLRVIPQANGNTLYIGPRASVVLSPKGWMMTCY